MESVDMFIKITTFGFWGSPKLKKKTVKMGWVVLYPAVLSNINCVEWKKKSETRNFLTYVLDGVESLEEFLFFNI